MGQDLSQQKLLLLQSHLLCLVITSYSIHYTKLYEFVPPSLELNRFGEIPVDCNCRTSLTGVFAAGDVTTVAYKQIIIAGGEGAKAALAAWDYLLKLNEEE